MTATTITPLSTYRNETPYPFCPGCGHHSILDQLNAALVALQLDPREIVLVISFFTVSRIPTVASLSPFTYALLLSGMKATLRGRGPTLNCLTSVLALTSTTESVASTSDVT